MAALDAALGNRPTIEPEQEAMVHQICESGAGVDVIEGIAGSGKTFALAAAHNAWTASGYRVRGACLAARAARQLEDCSGIPSGRAFDQYLGHDRIHHVAGSGDVRTELVSDWHAARTAGVDAIMVAAHEVLALRNDYRLGVLNGTRGIIDGIDARARQLEVLTEGSSRLSIPFDYAAAGHLTHGYHHDPQGPGRPWTPTARRWGRISGSGRRCRYGECPTHPWASVSSRAV